jgi:predicted deacetylase
MNSGPRRLLVSLHDATPFHLPRLRKAEALFRQLGVAKVAYLFVPEYHGRYPSAEHPDFVEWCRSPRPFAVDWFLHGFKHLETPEEPAAPTRRAVLPSEAAPGAAGDAWKRRLLTAGEGEFLALDEAAQRRKLQAGLASFRACLGADPAGFIAPAWLFNDGLIPLLKELGLPYTEDHRRIYRTDTGASLASPVVTWATRTFLRKYGSLVVCPLLARLWSGQPVLRVAMHPFDFDHPVTVRNIAGVLRKLLPGRVQSFTREVDFAA